MADTQIAGLGSAVGVGVNVAKAASSKNLKLESYSSNAKRLEPGNQILTIKTNALVGGAVASLNGVWNALLPALEAIGQKNGQKIKFPRTNFVDPLSGLDKLGGTYQARKWYKSGFLYIHFAVVS